MPIRTLAAQEDRLADDARFDACPATPEQQTQCDRDRNVGDDRGDNEEIQFPLDRGKLCERLKLKAGVHMVSNSSLQHRLNAHTSCVHQIDATKDITMSGACIVVTINEACRTPRRLMTHTRHAGTSHFTARCLATRDKASQRQGS
jgi:hypothetical protein